MQESSQDKATPKPQFEIRDVEGWKVYISKASLVEKKEETESALDHMANQLFQIKLVVPKKTLRELQRVPIWLANGEERLGIAFHPKSSWLTERDYQPPDLPLMIGVVRGKNYLHASIRQPWLVFHELVHGYDWLVLGKQQKYGIDAGLYERAMKSGKYVSALHWDSRYRKPYHAANRMELFAETSEAFFGTNDIYPFVRAELRAHDPKLFRELASLWNVDLDGQRRSSRALAKTLESSPLISGLEEAAKGSDESAAPAYAPTRRYARCNIEGWNVLIGPELEKSPKLAEKARRLLRRDLHYVKRYVPAEAVKKLKRTKIWLEKDNPDVPYLTFHASDKHLASRGDNVDKAGAVEIGNAENYLRWFGREPSIILHMLAYAYLQSEIDGGNDDLATALSRARKSGRYDKVLRFDGQRVRHPALANQYEFFAELSETYFGTNDHYPFIRGELKEADGKTCKIISRLWTSK
ncbi:MAG: hypothetical protein V3V75_07145 [Thermoguttaceae bacterium]